MRNVCQTIGGHLWAVGGITSMELEQDVIIEQVSRTTELYDFNTLSWESAASLELAVAGHCMIQLSTSSVLLAGGHAEDGSMPRLTKKYTLKPKVGTQVIQLFDVTESGLMRQARKYHTCGEFVSTDGDNLGYAAGGIGIDAEQESLDEVELSRCVSRQARAVTTGATYPQG